MEDIDANADTRNGISKEQRIWALVAHLSAFTMYFTFIGHLIGPLIVWLAKRDGNPFIDDQGKEALNFQISVTIYYAACGILIFSVIGAIIGIPLLVATSIFQVVCIIIAAIKASDGIAFRYPLTLRLVN